VNVRVRSFARIRELIGSDSQALDVPQGATVETVWSAIAERTPTLSSLSSSVRFALNGSIVEPSVKLKDGDEVALLPPSSGG